MPRRILEGNVVSDKMDKTVTVLVERRYMHPVYKKYLKRSDKYAAHDEHNAFRTGDRVQIEECRPLSKRKSWRVISEASADALKAAQDRTAAKQAEKAAAKPSKKAEAKTKAPAAEKPAKEKAPAKKPAAKKAAGKKKEDE